MDINELNDLISTCDMEKIKAGILSQGYTLFDPDRDNEYGITMFDIVTGEKSETPGHRNDTGEWEYFAMIFSGVIGMEDYEFIKIMQNKLFKNDDLSFPHFCEYYAKKIK